MSSNYIIGLSGYAQVGKDTVGAILVDDYGYKRVAFADCMKRMALAINPIIDWTVNERGTGGRPVRLDEIILAVGWERAKQNEEVRGLLQRLGTEAGRRELGDDIWVNSTFRTMQDPKGKFVITDVRFPNEAAAILERDGTLIRINRPGVSSVNGHESERALDDLVVPYTIENDGSLIDLGVKVQQVMEDIALTAVVG